MKSLVVYESMWGNTAQVARAVAEGLSGARVAEVHDVSPSEVQGLDLLVVGGPTHAFSMSRPSTRHDAHSRGASVGAEDAGVREWLTRLPAGSRMPVATFDTRVASVKNLPGSAAKAASRAMIRHHRGRVIGTCSFYVHDTAGPLVDGELLRAAAWGATLTEAMRPSRAG